MTHVSSERKRNLRRKLAASIVQQRVYLNFSNHYRSSLPFLSLHEFLSRAPGPRIASPPARAFTRRGGEKEAQGEGKSTEKQLAVNVPPLRAIPATTR